MENVLSWLDAQYVSFENKKIELRIFLNYLASFTLVSAALSFCYFFNYNHYLKFGFAIFCFIATPIVLTFLNTHLMKGDEVIKFDNFAVIIFTLMGMVLLSSIVLNTELIRQEKAPKYVFYIFLLGAILSSIFFALKRTVKVASKVKYLYIITVLAFPALILANTVFTGPWSIGTFNVVSQIAQEFYERKFLFQGGVFSVFIIWGLTYKTKVNDFCSNYRNLIKFFTFCIPFLFFDVSLTYEVQHYNAYIGPAHVMTMGGKPLIDVFGQYGLNFIYYVLWFKWFPHTYTSAAAATSLINAAYLLCAIVCLKKIIKDPFVLFISSFSMVFIYHMSYVFGFNMAPSVAGMRFFPSMFLLSVLVNLREGKFFSMASIFALWLNLFWCIESAFFGMILYACSLAVQASYTAKSLKSFVLKHFPFKLFQLLSVFLILVGGSVLAFYLYYNQLPRYDVYLDLVFAYVDQDSSLGANYVKKLEGGFYGWLNVVSAYILITSLLLFQLTKKINLSYQYLSPFFLLSCCGILYGGYFYIQPVSAIFMTVLLPAYVSMFGFYYLLVSSESSISKFTKIAFGIPVAFVLFLLLSVSYVRFSMPYIYGEANTVMLKHWLSYGSLAPEHFIDNMNSICQNKVKTEIPQEKSVMKIITACNIESNHDELMYHVNKWQGKDDKIAVLHPYQTEIQVDAKKRSVFPFSFSLADLYSKKLTKKILTNQNKMKAGDTLILSGETLSLNKIEYAVLNDIISKWDLFLVDATENVKSYRLTPKNFDGTLLIYDESEKALLEKASYSMGKLLKVMTTEQGISIQHGESHSNIIPYSKLINENFINNQKVMVGKFRNVVFGEKAFHNRNVKDVNVYFNLNDNYKVTKNGEGYIEYVVDDNNLGGAAKNVYIDTIKNKEANSLLMQNLNVSFLYYDDDFVYLDFDSQFLRRYPIRNFLGGNEVRTPTLFNAFNVGDKIYINNCTNQTCESIVNNLFQLFSIERFQSRSLMTEFSFELKSLSNNGVTKLYEGSPRLSLQPTFSEASSTMAPSTKASNLLNVGAGWWSSAGHDQKTKEWIILGFDEKKVIGSVLLYPLKGFEWRAPRNIDIYYSFDKIKWKKYMTVETDWDNTDRFHVNLSNLSAKYIKLSMDSIYSEDVGYYLVQLGSVVLYKEL